MLDLAYKTLPHLIKWMERSGLLILHQIPYQIRKAFANTDNNAQNARGLPLIVRQIYSINTK